MVDEGALAARLEEVRAHVADAARAAGRAPEDVRIIAVTKFQPVELVRALADLGVREVGENRHPEARDKAVALADRGLTWHFIGQLQTKKARQVRRYADVIHSIDRVRLVDALDVDDGTVVDCLVQIDLSGEPGRGGVAEDGLDALVERVLSASGLRLRGVMAVAPLGDDPRPAFARLRALAERVRRQAPDAEWISAGMSGDYRAAIAEGATHLRIGTAITGIRPPRR